MKKIFKLLLIVLLEVFVVGLSSCLDTTEDDSTKSSSNIHELGETFEYDDFEIKVANSVTFTTVDNEFSDYYEKDVVKLEATIKNKSKETNSLSFLELKYFGAKGSELDSLEAYFDDSIGLNDGDLSSGASYTKSFYMPYDGDGSYKIELGLLNVEDTIEFNVVIGSHSIANEKEVYGVGEKFRYHFMTFESQDITFTNVSNTYSTYYGKKIIRVPFKITNISSEAQHLNSYTCTIIGPNSVEADTADTYFTDSLGYNTTDLAYNGSYTKAFYIVYTTDGKYTIDFNSKVKFQFDVNVSNN
jgi:hypothetical protein